MISYLKTLPVGNALQLYLTPPAAALHWRILRRSSDAFTGADDVGAVRVVDGSTDSYVVDAVGLENGSTYYYRAYYFTASGWVASATKSGAPTRTLEDESVDTQELVRSRIELAMAAEVAAGVFRVRDGRIEVLNAPPRVDNTRFPVVSVHVAEDRPEVRGIGDDIFPDQTAADGQSVLESHGWYSRVSLDVIGWCASADERAEMRRALKRAVLGNLPVFDAFGLVSVDYHQSDVEDFQTYNMPMYQSVDRFSCLAPSSVGGTVDVIRSVESAQICEVEINQ